MEDALSIDLFAGGGGASEGFRMAMGRDPDVAINHDPEAIAMHAANHPGTFHYIQDVWQVPPRWVTKGKPVGFLWASPDCTHFSKAKGSAPTRDAKRRDLAWVIIKWMREVRPCVVSLENVEEFLSWGPLDSKGRIISDQSGATFRSFVSSMRRLGYSVQWRELRACDYGAPTIRKRLFLIARCDGQPIVWPDPTHGPGREHPYRTAAEIIDWSIPCPSIFERKRPLAENTLRRIAEGIRRYVIEAAEPFIVTYYGPKRPGDFRGCGMGGMLGTQTTENRHALVTPCLIPRYGERQGQAPRCRSVEDPLPTIVTTDNGAQLVAATLVTNTTGHSPASPESPLSTVTTGNHHMQVAALLKHFTGVVGQDVREPMGTVTTVDHHSVLTAHVMRQFGNSVGSPADDPIGTTTAGGGGKSGLVTSHLLKLRGTCRHGQPVDEPMPTVTASGTHVGEVRAFLMKYYREGGQWQSCVGPMHTLTTKARMGLVTVMIKGEPYVIADIGMRMLTPRELYLAQGFSPSYVIDLEVNGKPLTKASQVRMCGNSVSPENAKAIIAANYPSELPQRVAPGPLLKAGA